MSDTYLEKMNKSIVVISDLKEDPLEETRYWLTKTPEERIMALELLRMRIAGYDNTTVRQAHCITSRLQRIYTITERP